MKKVTTLLIGLCLLAYSLPTRAQEEERQRKDHTYSTHNYKHPNKAAAARRWEEKEGVSVETPSRLSRRDNRSANYKTQLPFQQPVGGVTVPHRLDEDVANRNYKMQKPSIGSGQDGSIARKRAKQAEDTTTTPGN